MKEQNDVQENVEAKNEDLLSGIETETEEIIETQNEEVLLSEEQNSDTLEEVEQSDVSEESPVQSMAKLGKHEEAEHLVEKAKGIVAEAENQLDKCKLLLATDLEAYEEAKKSLNQNGLEASEALLAKLGYQSEEETVVDADMVVFEPKEALEPIVIKEVSGGGFSSFILAFIVGLATLSGLVFLAMQKLNTSWYVSTLLTEETLKPVAQWYAALVGMADKPPVGAALVAVVVLLLMWIVYKVRVSLRASRNLSMAKEQLEAAEAYSVQKGTCKEEMDKVDAYINESIETLNLYQVILNEQQAKLKRIAHIENDKIDASDFHPKSSIEMQDTQDLISFINDFISVPMSEEGKLSGKSSLFLNRAKSKVEKVIDRLY